MGKGRNYVRTNVMNCMLLELLELLMHGDYDGLGMYLGWRHGISCLEVAWKTQLETSVILKWVLGK